MAENKVLKNTVYLFLARLFSAALSFVVIVFFARRNVELLGKFTLVYAYFIIFTEMPLLGLNFFITRELSKKNESIKSFFFIGNILSFVSVIILTVVLWLIISKAGYPEDVSKSLFWVIVALYPSAFIMTAQAILMAFEKITAMSKIILYENIARPIAAIAVFSLAVDIPRIFFIFFMIRIIFAIIYADILRQNRMFPESFHWDSGLFQATLKHWPVFCAIYILALLSSKIDHILLSKLGSIRDVGFYAASYKFLDLLLMAPAALCYSILPVLSREDFAGNGNQVLSLFIKYFSILAIPIVSFFYFNAQYVLSFFYGNEYVQSGMVLSILIFNFLIMGCDQMLATLLIAKNLQQLDLKILSMSFIYYVVSLIFLTPHFGYIGAAISTVTTGILLFAIRVGYIIRRNMGVNFHGLNKNILFSCALFAFIIFIGRMLRFHGPISWVLFITLYTAGIFTLNIVTPAENKLITGNIARLLNPKKAS